MSSERPAWVRGVALVPWPYRLLIVGLCFGGWVWGALTYQGPWRWVSEASLALIGVQELQLTGLLSLLIWMAPAMLLLGLWGARIAADEPHRLVQQPSSPVDWNGMIEANRSLVMVTVLALGLIGLGGWLAVRGALQSETTAMELSALEAGDGPLLAHVHTSGHPIPDLALEILDEGRSRWYVPLVSSAWRPGDAIALFVRLPHPEMPDLSAGLEGKLAGNGLPGVAISAYEQGGVTLAEPHWVLRPGAPGSPEEGLWMLGLGLLLQLGATFGWRRALPAWRRNPARAEARRR